MANILKPLYSVLQKEKKWEWTNNCSDAFLEIKQELISKNALAHFDPNVKLKLTVDASPYGLGAVLSHVYETGAERPISFASRVLTNTKQKYAQIDKEVLAIVFGVQKFHQYLFGNKFLLETDIKRE